MIDEPRRESLLRPKDGSSKRAAARAVSAGRWPRSRDPQSSENDCGPRGGAGENRTVFGEGRSIAGDQALWGPKIGLGGVTGGVTGLRCSPAPDQRSAMLDT